jgi:glutamate/tyrosine decarboxylase-like PLP-dependent enzyme
VVQPALWFSLATHGTAAYAAAIETTLRVAREGARLVAAAPHLELLLEPELSIVLFRRLGWDAARHQAWSDDQLARQQSFVTPTTWRGETVLRWCIVNPLTTVEDLAAIVASLEDPDG